MMLRNGERRWQNLSWGAVVSVALHAVIAVVLLIHLPAFESTPPTEESVSVELVPPPEEKAPEEAPAEEEQTKEERPADQPPPPPEMPPEQEAKAEEKVPIPVLRPVLEFGAKDAGPQKDASDVGRRAPEEKQAPKPAETAATEDRPETVEPPASALPHDLKLPEAGSEDGVPPAADEPPVNSATLEPDEAAKPEAASAPEQAEPRRDELTEAKKIYSEQATEDAVAMTAMGDLPRATRVEQLCSTELYAQLRHASPPYNPELLPSYRLSRGTVLEVRRAAFRANTRWYDLSFRCEVDKDATRVVSFAFDVGSEVPKSEWRSRGFPAL